MASACELRLDKGQGCYFYAQFAADSFCGHLDSAFEVAEGFDESAIADFVKAAKPSLFRQLGSLPVSSTDIRISTPTPEESSSKSVSVHTSARSGSQKRTPENQVPTHHKHLSSTLRQPPQHIGQYMLHLQHKRYIQLCVLNGDDLTIRKLVLPSFVLPCSDPQCAKDTSIVPEGSFFLTLSKSVLDPAAGVIKKSMLHYSLTCLEALFDQGLAVRTPYDIHGYFDQLGSLADFQSYHSWSEVDGQVDDLVDVSGFPYHYPSNSPEALYLRGKRFIETTAVPLTPVRGERPVDSMPTSASKTPTLKLSRPSDVSPYDRRYKKQGLTYENRRKSRISEQLDIKPFPLTSQPAQEDRICYCREPADGSELVQCCSPNCMIGTFHLRCLNLEEPLEEGEEVYCSYCAESLGADDDRENESDALPVTGEVHAEHRCQSVPTSPLPKLLEDSDVHGEQVEGAPSSDTNTSSNTDRPSPSAFVAINCPLTNLSVFHCTQTDGARSPLPATPYLKPTSATSSQTRSDREKKQVPVSLQPDSSQISFADLAPFIGVSHLSYSPLGLTNEEAEAFLNWKQSCPKSRLLDALPVRERVKKGLKPSDAWDRVNTRGCILPENGLVPHKLSKQLSIINKKEISD